jgi:hypothetical protein
MLSRFLFVLFTMFSVVNSTQPTSQPTRQPSSQPSIRPFSSPTARPSSPSSRPSCQPTSQPVLRPSGQPTNSPSSQPSRQPTYQPTSRPTGQPITRPSRQPSSQPTSQPSRQPSSQPTRQPSQKPTSHPSRCPSTQPVGDPSTQPSSAPTDLPSTQPTGLPSAQPNSNPTGLPSSQPSARPSQPSSLPSGAPSTQPSSQPSSNPTCQPSSLPTGFPSSQPSKIPSQQPFAFPTGYPSTQPTAVPSNQPSSQPSSFPSGVPSSEPSKQPSSQPTGFPSSQPTMQPSGFPSSQPSGHPSRLPTCQPSGQPTGIPSNQPSNQPSVIPSNIPTSQPSNQPTSQPTRQPTNQPSLQPTSFPSSQPSSRPTCQPSLQPSSQPSGLPSSQPSSQPTNPTSQPTQRPSRQPTGVPSMQPTSRPSSAPTGLTPHCEVGYHYVLNGGRLHPFDCIPCQAGFFNDKIKQPNCDPCPKGWYSKEGANNCTVCPRNHYSENMSSPLCNSCPDGYVNGKEGSYLHSDCVNPTINFVSAGISLILCGFVVLVYLLYGRFQKVAFQRQWRLTTKCVILFAAMSTTADLVTVACHEMDDFIHREENETLWQALVRVIFKPLLFYFLVFLAVPLIILGVAFQSLLKTLFKTMVLWRAYRASDLFFHSFLSFLHEFDHYFFQKFDFQFFSIILWPFLKVYNFIQSINFNFWSLPEVHLTCTGSQAPAFLLADLVVLSLIIVVIEADYQVLWTTTVQPAAQKIQTIIFSRYYFGQNKLSTITAIGLSYALSFVPDPTKVIQYALGWVSVLVLFRAESNENCDGAVRLFGSKDKTFPLDSIYAVLTTICASGLIFPAIYVLSEVLVPSTKAQDIKNAEEQYDDEVDEDAFAVKKNIREFRIYEKADSVTRTQFLKLIGFVSALDWIFFRTLFMFGNFILSRQQRFLLQPFRVTAFASDKNHPFHDIQTTKYEVEMKQMIKSTEDVFTMKDSLIKIRSRVIFAKKIPNLPWFDALDSEDVAETALDRGKEKKVWKTVKANLPSFIEMSREVQEELDKKLLLGGWALSWFFLAQICTEIGYMRWKWVARSYLAMLLASFGYWPDWVAEIFDLKPSSIESDEESVKKRKARDWETYFTQMYDEIYHTFSLDTPDFENIAKKAKSGFSKYDRYDEISNSIYRGGHDTDNDAFVRIENDRRVGFSQFMSATVATRIILIQVFPFLTLLATILTDLSSFPLFVSKYLDRQCLPPKIDFDCAKDAITYLKDEKGDNFPLNPSVDTAWTVFTKALSYLNPIRRTREIEDPNEDDDARDHRRAEERQKRKEEGQNVWLALFVTVYLFVNRSRVVNFIITLALDLIPVAIAFRPNWLYYAIPAMAGILFTQGLLSGIYVAILVYRFFFRESRKRTTRTTTASDNRIVASSFPSPQAPGVVASGISSSSADDDNSCSLSNDWNEEKKDMMEEKTGDGHGVKTDHNVDKNNNGEENDGDCYNPSYQNPAHVVAGVFWKNRRSGMRVNHVASPGASSYSIVSEDESALEMQMSPSSSRLSTGYPNQSSPENRLIRASTDQHATRTFLL